MTYAQIMTAKKRHELAAQMLRYAKYNAQCCHNPNCAQPYQVNVKGASNEEVKELQDAICSLLNDDTINIVAI